MMMFNAGFLIPMFRKLPLLRIVMLFLFSFMAVSAAHAQSTYSPQSEQIFQDALEHYRNFDYQKAAEVFGEIDDIPEAVLLRGNSLYALGRYKEAVQVLEKVLEADLLDVSQEARYTLGLTELSRRNYEAGLLYLHQLGEDTAYSPELAMRAQEQKQAYVGFLSYDQRLRLLDSEALQEAPGLAFELIETGMKLHPADRISELYTRSQRSGISEDQRRSLQELLRSRREADEADQEDESGDENSEEQTSPTDADEQPEMGTAEENAPIASAEPESEQEAEKLYIPDVSVPDGFTYHIGVILPQQKPDEQGYEVSRGLYFGLLMAAEEYNRRQNDRRVQLHLVNMDPVSAPISDSSDTAAQASEIMEAFNQFELPSDSLRSDSLAAGSTISDSTAVAVADSLPPVQRYTKQLLEDQEIDVLFGPLFTSEAAELAEIAREYNIPLIAPLANSRDLTQDNEWFFHANPTFKVRGRRMAEIATQYMGEQRISILVEQGSLGEIDAKAFRNRAIELGAQIPYFYNENLQAQQFDVRPFTRLFTSDVELLNIREEKEEVAFINSQKPTDALYVPLTGRPAPTIFDLLMTQLQALRSEVRVIGSQELGSVDVNPAAARQFELVYPETFYRAPEDEELFDEFEEVYKNLFGREADFFSYIGYNTGRFMQLALESSGNPVYSGTALRLQPAFDGLGQKIDFNGTQINQAIIPLTYGDDGYEPLFVPEDPIHDIIRERAEEIRRWIEEGVPEEMLPVEYEEEEEEESESDS
jgi:ABC-type branched-subunit amino acid transport system substrate-binding protein/tetratricopeptide (TPR) repeat protein